MHRPSFSRSFPLPYGGREKAFLKRAFFSAPNDFSISGKRFFVLCQMIFSFQPVGFPFSSWRKAERWVSHPSVVLYVGTQCFIVQPERWSHFSENSWGRRVITGAWVDFYFNLMGFGKEMLYLRCLCLCWKPLTGRAWGRYIYIKGVTVRFGFDGLRTSQLQQYVKNKATGTPYGMYIIYSCRWMAKNAMAGRLLYIYISVGLSALLVSTYWAMRRPLDRGTSDRTGSTFLYVSMKKQMLLTAEREAVG